MYSLKIQIKRKAFTGYMQMEDYCLEKTSTADSAQRLAEQVIYEFKHLVV